MATVHHQSLGQSLLPGRRQVGLWPLCTVVWYMGKMWVQKRSQFFAEENINISEKKILSNQSLFFPEKDLRCDSLFCEERL